MIRCGPRGSASAQKKGSSIASLGREALRAGSTVLSWGRMGKAGRVSPFRSVHARDHRYCRVAGAQGGVIPLEPWGVWSGGQRRAREEACLFSAIRAQSKERSLKLRYYEKAPSRGGADLYGGDSSASQRA